VSCPTLVLHAREDGRVPFEEARSLATIIPEARFVPLESRNHILVEGEPAWQQFAVELEDFLPATRSAPTDAMAALTDDLTPRERALPHRECYRRSPAMTGAALANRIAGAHGGEHQHGRAARGGVGGGGALPISGAG
jgi:hypothetical protein